MPLSAQWSPQPVASIGRKIVSQYEADVATRSLIDTTKRIVELALEARSRHTIAERADLREQFERQLFTTALLFEQNNRLERRPSSDALTLFMTLRAHYEHIARLFLSLRGVKPKIITRATRWLPSGTGMGERITAIVERLLPGRSSALDAFPGSISTWVAEDARVSALDSRKFEEFALLSYTSVVSDLLTFIVRLDRQSSRAEQEARSNAQAAVAGPMEALLYIALLSIVPGSEDEIAAYAAVAVQEYEALAKRIADSALRVEQLDDGRAAESDGGPEKRKRTSAM